MKPRKSKLLTNRQSGKCTGPEISHHQIAAELKQLTINSIATLRDRYKVLLGEDPPGAFGPDLLRRRIAGRLQEEEYGSLPRQTVHLLHQMLKGVSTKPNGQLEFTRRIKPGSELVRDWKGKRYRVSVKQDGFAYGEKTYPNLSVIASEITGTNWNGPRFFGLRAKAEATTTNGK